MKWKSASYVLYDYHKSSHNWTYKTKTYKTPQLEYEITRQRLMSKGVEEDLEETLRRDLDYLNLAEDMTKN
ncbi:hypothetical protein DVH24_003652 [Malus domestica]|uniref:Uncharacterized protein n=1 Tax=Malus domestica TaxID=3750 RepID=A0A498ILW0_MALDO|nr:hypothetical protein DVH24_003652 [Malus domestica]